MDADVDYHGLVSWAWDPGRWSPPTKAKLTFMRVGLGQAAKGELGSRGARGRGVPHAVATHVQADCFFLKS